MVCIFWSFFSVWVGIQSFKLRKEPNYYQIRELESVIGLLSLSITSAAVLLILSVFGFASAYVHSATTLVQEEMILKIFMYFLTVSSIVPVMVFMRKHLRKQNINSSIDGKANVDIQKDEKLFRENVNAQSGVTSIFVLLMALVAFLIGLLFRTEK